MATPSTPAGRRMRDRCRLVVAMVALACEGCGASPQWSFDDNDGSAATQSDATAPSGGNGSGTLIAGNAGPGSAGGDSSPSQPTPGARVPLQINECPGALNGATVTVLQAGGPTDPSMKWLYPYDNTVFPGGVLPPTLQWTQSSGPDAVYLHIHSSLFDYKGCFGGSNPPQLGVPQPAWDGAWAQGGGKSDPLTVELTTMTGGIASGPIREVWTFARGSLKSMIYYNTYTSQLAGNNGAVMSIAPGASMPSVLIAINGTSPVGPCVSCHSVSADGRTLVAQRHFYLFGGSNGSGLVDSESYDLSKGATLNVNAPLDKVMNDDWGLSAVYPDGSRLLTDGQPTQTAPPFPGAAGNNPGMLGPAVSTMYDPRTGATIPFSGLASKYAMMPMFSPDGKKVVFNDADHGGGHSLAVMDFDPTTNVFSNPTMIFHDPNLYPGWPFFTPDSRKVVFVVGDANNFATTHNPPNQTIAKSDLYIVDAAGGTAQPLDAANGYTNGQSYLPYPGRDEHLNFYPTVSPVSSGGYFWVYFTSRRSYGNMLASSRATIAVADATDTKSMKIWVTPIEISETGQAASHPAFYLSGQELVSGNIRAFAALQPCKADGQSCSSGIDCCNGACTNTRCAVPRGCSNLDEKCTAASDCCDNSLRCIGGFCASDVAK
ncbi:MAG: hypothetical protein M3O46_22910 [Myxococcota bacterium]|nr:hypothetical protein [Myxococcota bacterium]